MSSISGAKWDSAAAANFVKACRSHVDGLVGDINKTLDSSREEVRASESANMTAKSNLQNLRLAVGEKNRELARVETDRTAIKRELTSAGNAGRSSAKNRRQEAEAEYDRVNGELSAFQESAAAKMNRVKTDIAATSDRLRDLEALIIQDDNALKEMSLNRAELERLGAIERQCNLDHEACMADAAMFFSQFLKSLPVGASRVDLPASLTGVSDVSNLADALDARVRQQKDVLAAKKAVIDNAKKLVYQCSATLTADENRQLELRNKIAASESTVEALGVCLVKLNAMRREGDFTEAGEVYRDLTVEDSPEVIESALHLVEEALTDMSKFIESSKHWRARLLKKSKPKGASASNKFVCPCCDRGMNAVEKSNFDSKVDELFKFAEAEAGSEASKQKLDTFNELNGQTLEALKKLRPYAEYKADLSAVSTRITQQKIALNDAR